MRGSGMEDAASPRSESLVLVLNCGSSSVKYTVYERDSGCNVLHGTVDRVTDYVRALNGVFEETAALPHGGLSSVCAVGHRVVHGGRKFRWAHRVNGEVLKGIRNYVDLAPLHNPFNILGIEYSAQRLPEVPQVAVFDTSFHSGIPPKAHNYAIPLEMAMEHRIRRYGFHGISHHYVHDRALEISGNLGRQDVNVITCHLGAGCSIAAVKGGRCVDTSMGFTPLEGLVMGTRCGDIDPAVVHYLMSPEGGGMTSEEVHDLLNKKSGLKGLSGLSSDVRDLLKAREEGHEGARLALSVFTYRLKKYIGAYHAVLGGADVLVFTAGIGENSPEIRAESLEGLESLGFVMNVGVNSETIGAEGIISTRGSRVRIFVIPTDEDRMIYKETVRLIIPESKVRGSESDV
jgi:acetate kinase